MERHEQQENESQKNAHLETSSTLLFMVYRLCSSINLEQLIHFIRFFLRHHAVPIVIDLYVLLP